MILVVFSWTCPASGITQSASFHLVFRIWSHRPFSYYLIIAEPISLKQISQKINKSACKSYLICTERCTYRNYSLIRFITFYVPARLWADGSKRVRFLEMSRTQALNPCIAARTTMMQVWLYETLKISWLNSVCATSAVLCTCWSLFVRYSNGKDWRNAPGKTHSRFVSHLSL